MDGWSRLLEIPDDRALSRGTVFRFPAKPPYEAFVEFLLFDPLRDDASLGFIVLTGYKAGLQAQLLPLDAWADNNSRWISGRWMKKNWDMWVYPECSVMDVYVCDGISVSVNSP